MVFSLKEISNALGCSVYVARQWIRAKDCPVRVRRLKRRGGVYSRYCVDREILLAWAGCKTAR